MHLFVLLFAVKEYSQVYQLLYMYVYSNWFFLRNYIFHDLFIHRIPYSYIIEEEVTYFMFKDKETIIHNGITIPTLGYRVIPNNGDTYKNTLLALETGYRLFDIACDAETQKAFGQALHDSSVERKDIFLILKVANKNHTYNKAIRGFKNSLSRCQTDYADLLLIDWPNPKEYRSTYETSSVETWKAVEDIYKQGSARTIGVANYESRHIEYLLENCEISPMVNEARIYPGFPFTDNLKCANEHKIVTAGFLQDNYKDILQSKELQIFAEKYNVTAEQICIRYLFEKDCIALTVGTDKDILASNFHAYDFELTDKDMAYLDVMKNYGDENINPDTADF